MIKTKITYIDRDKPETIPDIPPRLARCPICAAQLVIEDIDEWEANTGRVTRSGFHIACTTQPGLDETGWCEWFEGHYRMPYVDWLPVELKVFMWFDGRYRLKNKDKSP